MGKETPADDEMEAPRRGRPTLYRPEYAEQANELCEKGATDMELAIHFGVNVGTIYSWKHSQPEFFKALSLGKDACDDRVERSLYQRAVGYSFNSEKIYQYQGEIIRADIIEHIPPDPGAQMSWLKNRRGDKWRDKIDHEHSAVGDLADLIASRRLKVQEMNSGE